MLERFRTLLGESETVRLDFSAGGNPFCANAARPCEVLSVEAGVSPANQTKAAGSPRTSPCRRGERIRPPQQAQNGSSPNTFLFAKHNEIANHFSCANITIFSG